MYEMIDKCDNNFFENGDSHKMAACVREFRITQQASGRKWGFKGRNRKIIEIVDKTD